jgi:hypothetical protein
MKDLADRRTGAREELERRATTQINTHATRADMRFYM